MENVANNLKNIKSNYILKDIFSFLTKKIGLRIIRHNRKIQNKLEIKKEDFINTSGRYIKKDLFGLNIFSDNNYCDYTIDTNILIFKGSYNNGIKNGYGTEFYTNGNKKFEGEYKNGIKIKGKFFDKLGNEYLNIDNQKGEEYFTEGNRLEYWTNKKKLKFIGEYFNGKKWTGKGYDIDGNLVYEMKYGKGLVTEFFDDGKIKFKGEYNNGERNGKGIQYDYEGEVIFEGEYFNGERWTGKGKEYFSDIIDKTTTIDSFNMFKQEKSSGITFSNMFGTKKKTKNIFGGFFNTSDESENQFNDILKTKNFFSLSTGKNYLYRITLYNIDQKVLKYEGEYLNGKRHGKGKEYSKYKSLRYEGEFRNGKYHGQGKLFDEYFGILGKAKYEGEFRDGEYKG